MSSIGFENFVSIAIIGLYFFGISFLWLLPLYLWLKKWILAIQFVIPVSLSVQILFGYVFYSLEASQYYILPYLIILSLINLYCMKTIGFRRIISKMARLKRLLSWKKLAIFLFFLVVVSFTRFYDSFSTVAPGNNDTYNHIMFLKDVSEVGYIRSVSYYAPGFHLLVLPLTQMLPFPELYRFVGPVLGGLSVLAIFLLIRPALRNRLSKYVLLALLCFPVFNQLTLQSIGFFSTSLTFIYMTAFLMLLGFSNNNVLPHRYALTILLTLGLVVTVPYFFVQYSVALALLLFVAFLFRSICSRSFVIRLAIMMVISFLGVVGGYLHVLLQTSLHDSSYFPTVVEPVVSQSEAATVLTEQGAILEIPFISKNVMPLVSAGADVVKVKAIRSPDSILALGAYGWIVISIGIGVIAILHKRRSLLVLAILSLVYGIITQTGMVEMTTYKGRSGWYLLLLTILGMTFVYDRYFSHVNRNYLITIVLVLSLSSFIEPPTYYRPYHVEQLEVLEDVLPKHGGKTTIYSDINEVALINDGIVVKPLSLESLQSGLDPNSIVVANKVKPDIDPVLSQQALVTDKGFTNFALGQQEEAEKKRTILNEYLKTGGCQSELVIYESEFSLICSHSD